MTGQGARRLARSLLALTIALFVVAFTLAALNGFANAYGWGSNGVIFALFVPGLASGVVGALIATRHPRNAVGWICLGIAVALALNLVAAHYAYYGIETDPGELPASKVVATLAEWSWLAWVGPLFVHLVLVFPDGRLPSGRWRSVAWLGAAAFIVVAVCGALGSRSLEQFPGVRNPLRLENAGDLLEAVSSLALNLLLPSCIIAAAVSMVLRFRRAGDREREQIKWFAFAVGVLAVLIPIGELTFFQQAGPRAGQGALVAQDLITAGFAAPLIATGIAILRHRLYDIDVVINRALVYGALTATLAATYVATVLLLQLALSSVTEDSGLAVAVSTLAVAGLFRPARARIQAAVDQRFYRRKYDAQRTLEQFGARLRDELDLDALSAELSWVVADTMQPAHVSLWLRQPEARP